MTAVVLFLGLGACLWNGLGLTESGCSPIPLAAAGALYAVIGGRLPRRALGIQAAAVAALLVYCVAVSRFIINGWNVVMNSLFGVLELRLGYIFPRYEAAADVLPPEVCAGLFLALPAVLLGLLSARAVWGRRLWLVPTAVLVIAIWAFGTAALYPPDWGWVLLVLGLALLGAWSLQRENLVQGRAAVLGTAVQICLILLVCAVPAVLGNESGAARALQTRRDIAGWIHRARYEPEKTTLPEGDFRGLGDFEPGETTALTVIMEDPRELYLRGYVGEVYTGSGWAALEAEQKAPYATLFSWLHERGFYGQEQAALLCGALGLSGQENAVTITVEDACTGWRYAPYGLRSGETDPRQIGDADWPASGLHGEREYSYSMAGVSAADYERLSERLSQARRAGNQAALDYLTSENAYREFVYASYLDVPEEAHRAISQALSGLELPGGELSFRDAQTVVRAFLSGAVSYSETPRSIENGTDFLDGFLNGTKEGYSVHYATAAALLFRYLGVPARYVEGWYLPESAAAELTSGEPAELDQSFAHAWVEIYRDGVGFVPFEITPPYTAPMEQSGQALGGSGGAELPPEEEPPALTPWQAALLALACLLLLLLLLAAAVIVRRAVKRRRIRGLLERTETSAAVSNLTTWSVRLLSFLEVSRTGDSLSALVPEVERVLGSELAEQYRAAVEAQRRAVFSRDGADERDRALLRQLEARLEQELKSRSPTARRWKLRWVECVI